jgi:hypothetical protein
MNDASKPGPFQEFVAETTLPPGPEPHVHPETGLRALMEDRHHRVEVAAYFLAERRGFVPGHELDDWLEAEDAIEAEDAARAAED